MGRPPKDRTGPATETLTLRLTKDDRALLDRLVALRSAELADEAVEVSATSYVRALIRREARAKGLVDERPAGQDAAPLSKGTGPGGEPSADEVRAMLVRALKDGAVQAQIAKGADIDASALSKFRKKEKSLSTDALRRLAATLAKPD